MEKINIESVNSPGLKELYLICTQDIKLLTLFMSYYNKVQSKEVELNEKDSTAEYIGWNLITDYDDSYNTGEPYPFDYLQYNALIALLDPTSTPLTCNPQPRTNG
jgi:hypothetical protein